jgi:hypothetical protein
MKKSLRLRKKQYHKNTFRITVFLFSDYMIKSKDGHKCDTPESELLLGDTERRSGVYTKRYMTSTRAPDRRIRNLIVEGLGGSLSIVNQFLS